MHEQKVFRVRLRSDPIVSILPPARVLCIPGLQALLTNHVISSAVDTSRNLEYGFFGGGGGGGGGKFNLSALPKGGS